MKKFILFATIPVVLFSCKKETEQPQPIVNETGLEAWFKFSSNYNDATGKATGIGEDAASFITDRKGTPNAAVHVDGSGGVRLNNIFLKGKAASISVWIAKEDMNINTITYFLVGGSFGFLQYNEQINGAVSHPATNSVEADCPDLGWHHYVLSFDGNDIRYYKDGILAGVTNHPGGYGDGKKDFTAGYSSNNYWKGNLDDIRFYSRVLTDAEVLQLSKE
jgi:hypothetical protein